MAHTSLEWFGETRDVYFSKLPKILIACLLTLWSASAFNVFRLNKKEVKTNPGLWEFPGEGLQKDSSVVPSP